MKEHRYDIKLKWTGNLGAGTKKYEGYSRDYIVSSEEKPDIKGSSESSFRGDDTRYNPEELLLSSISSCHMLWYLHLCSNHDIVVTSYHDHPVATMIEKDDGSGAFEQVVLRPEIVISEGSNKAMAKTLHNVAHKMCFIANSCNFEILQEPIIRVNAKN
jgi:organic hydroperoxide reductase OsmC/OhrA